jgi:hypothetical protein
MPGILTGIGWLQLILLPANSVIFTLSGSRESSKVPDYKILMNMTKYMLEQCFSESFLSLKLPVGLMSGCM